MRHVTLHLPNGKALKMDAPEHLFIPRVLAREGLGQYETDTLAATLAILAIRDGLFIDIGANVGVFSLLVASVLQRECHAYEPLPDASKVLRDTVEANGLSIHVSDLALADRSGHAEFYVSAQTDSSSGLNRRFRKAKSSFQATLARLDDVIDEAKPALIKVDTETTEPQVLAGAQSTLERCAPYLIVEVLRNRTEERLQSFFEGRGYHWYHITDAERWPQSDRIEGDASYQHNNWLFAPEPLDDPFWAQLTHWRKALRSVAP